MVHTPMVDNETKSVDVMVRIPAVVPVEVQFLTEHGEPLDGGTWQGKTRDISDTGLAQLVPLAKLERLELLYSEGFAGPQITDVGLRALRGHRQLRSLNLVGAKITDDGLQHLSQLEQLESLRVGNTRLSDAAVERLQSQLPRCRIIR